MFKLKKVQTVVNYRRLFVGDNQRTLKLGIISQKFWVELAQRMNWLYLKNKLWLKYCHQTALGIVSVILTTLRLVIPDKNFYYMCLWIDEKVTVYVQAAEPAHQTNYVIQKS